MPTVNVSGVGTVNFPDGMSQAAIVAAIENDILPNAARYGIQGRAANPPDARFGDPNGNTAGITGGDVGKAIGVGTAHLAGIPTNTAEVPEAVKNWALNFLTMGQYGPTKMAVNAVTDAVHGRVPIIGGAVNDVAAPAVAYAHGNAPTHDQNMRAMEAGTSLAEMAALQHPAVGAAISRIAPAAGAALEQSGTNTYANALAEEGAPLRPLAESIGSQLAGEGKVMANPRQALKTAFGGSQGEAVPVEKFAKTGAQDSQLKALQEKYPDATVTDDGNGNFVVNKPGPRSLNQQGADTLAKQAPRGEILSSRSLTSPAGIADAVMTVKRLVQSPLWKTVSGVLKTQVGRAMQAQDFGTVLNAGAKILAGENLDDEYGHDSALHGLIDTITQHGTVQMSPPEIRQALDDYGALYVSPDGTSVPVPFHVAKQMKDKLGGQ